MREEAERKMPPPVGKRICCRETWWGAGPGKLREGEGGMLVLLDIEWVEDAAGDRELTQLSAARVDDAWNLVEGFDALVRPGDPGSVSWEHMEYNGYAPEEFLAGEGEEDCARRFFRWLRPEDTLCCWHFETAKTLLAAYERYLAGPFPAMIPQANERAREVAEACGVTAKALYKMAGACGVSVPVPEHRAFNDVTVLRMLLRALNLSRETLTEVSPAGKGMLCQSKGKDGGAERPGLQERGGGQEEVVWARLIDGRTIRVRRGRLVGRCHSTLHPGKLTERLLVEHNCLGKGYPFLERYEAAGYWTQWRRDQEKKRRSQEARRMRRERAAAEEAETADLRERFQAFAEAAGYSMTVIRVEKEGRNRYRVFYVSDYPFADGNRFPLFLEAVRSAYPACRLDLRHIRDVDGHFVTNGEYQRRRK